MSHMHNSRKYRKKRNGAKKRQLRATIRMTRRWLQLARAAGRRADARQVAYGVTAFRTKQTKGHDPTDLTVEWFRGFCQ